jgi:hypothetical protein
MTINNPITNVKPRPNASVKKTFNEAQVLAGFMDDSHFRSFVADHLAAIPEPDQGRVLKAADDCRAAVSSLAAVALDDVVIRPLVSSRVDEILREAAFVQVFRDRATSFAWIRPRHVAALQVHVRAGKQPVPADEEGLVEWALPLEWDVPAEISFTPPLGPIQIVSSSPNLNGLQAELDGSASRVILQPAKHINLIQVVSFGGRHYLRNGYNRVVDALAAGVEEIPAVVVQAVLPQDVALAPGWASFDLGFVMGVVRPPLMSDFHSAASLIVPTRERRYGVSIALQISPINIGI